MRYVALLLLVVAFVFFIFLKPRLKDYSVDISLGDVDISSKGIHLKSFMLNLSAGRERSFFLYIGNASFIFGDKEKKSFFQLEETSIILVNLRKPRRRERPLKLRSFAFVKGIDLRIKDLYLSFLGYRSSLTSFVEDFQLLKGRIRGFARFYYLSRRARNTFNVRIREAVVKQEGVFINSVRVDSPIYDFSGRGVWRWGEGEFTSEGYIKKIETKHILIPRIDIRGEGNIDLTGIKIRATGEAGLIRLKGRRDFKDVKAIGNINITFGIKNHIAGRLWSEETEVEYLYKVFPEGELRAFVKRFPVDSALLGIQRELEAELKGEVRLKLEEEKLNLEMEVLQASFEDNVLGKGYLNMNMKSFLNPVGSFELELRDTSHIRVEGSFRKGFASGSYVAENFPLTAEAVSGRLMLSGSFEITEGKGVRSSGGGSVSALSIRGINLGRAEISYSLKGSSLNLNINSTGYAGYISKEDNSLKARFRLRNFSTRYEDILLSVDKGRLELLGDGKDTHVSLFLDGGRVSTGELEIKGVRGVLYLNPDKEEGFLGVHIDSFRAGDFFRERGYLFGKYKDGLVEGLYSVKGLVEGSYKLNPKEAHFKTLGQLKFKEGEVAISAVYRGELKEDELGGGLSGSLSFRNRSLPISLKFSVKENRLSAKLEPSSYRETNMNLKLGGVSLEGDWNRIEVSIGESSLKLLGREVLKVVRADGYILPQRKELYIDGIKLQGAVEGELSVRFIEGVRVTSRGRLNLGMLSLLFGSLLRTRAEGYINYVAGYNEGKPYLELFSDRYFTLRSEYLALPMSGSVNFSLIEGKPHGYLYIFNPLSKLLVSVEPHGKEIILNLKGKNVPLRYKSEGLYSVIYADSKGRVVLGPEGKREMFLDTKVSGRVRITKTELLNGKEGKGNVKLPFKLLLSITPRAPIRVVLPEGYINLRPGGVITAGPDSTMYAVSLNLVSGELNYFGRNFYIRKGWFLMEKKTEDKKFVNLSIVSVEDGVSIYIDLVGELPIPKVYLRSDPPMDRKEILTRLVLGGITEGVIPVASSLITEFTYFTRFRRDISGLLGLDIRFLTHTGSQGDIGLNVLVSKRLSNIIRLEYQQSTLKDPRATFYGVSANLEPLGVSVGARTYSDNTKGFRLKIRRKFDF